MKKLSAIIILAGCVSITSCKKYLNEQPRDAVSDQNYWRTEADAVNAVNNCYTRLGDVDNRIFISCATDDSYSWSDWPSDVRLVGNGSASTGTGMFANFWSNFYKMIASCNDVLDNIDKDKALSDDMNLRLKGEARFIRAFAYQQLIGLYGDVPLITHIQSVSEFQVSRTPRSQVADFIGAQLDSAATELPATYSASDLGRATKGAALALKARTMLYEGRYDEAATAAQQVMSLSYSIDPDYLSLFNGTNKNSPEIIFSARYVKTNLPSAMATWVGGPTIGGWSQVVPLQGLVDAYEDINGVAIDQPGTVYDPAHPYNNRDPRLKLTVVVPGPNTVNGNTIDITAPGSLDALSKNNASYTGYYYKKYVPADIQGDWYNNSYNDVVLIRYAEVLLTYAEAKIELNQIDQTVYDAINQVRQRADVMMPLKTAANTAGQAALRDAVRRERHVEFPMEDNRLFDIRRWKIAETVMTGEAYGVLNNFDPTRSDYGKHVPVELRSFNNPRDYLWPVPQGEVALNPKLLPNNTGW
jgi:starch-binding outer membrane protein, SusD/RagB family